MSREELDNDTYDMALGSSRENMDYRLRSYFVGEEIGYDPSLCNDFNKLTLGGEWCKSSSAQTALSVPCPYNGVPLRFYEPRYGVTPESSSDTSEDFDNQEQTSVTHEQVFTRYPNSGWYLGNDPIVDCCDGNESDRSSYSSGHEDGLVYRMSSSMTTGIGENFPQVYSDDHDARYYEAASSDSYSLSSSADEQCIHPGLSLISSSSSAGSLNLHSRGAPLGELSPGCQGHIGNTHLQEEGECSTVTEQLFPDVHSSGQVRKTVALGINYSMSQTNMDNHRGMARSNSLTTLATSTNDSQLKPNKFSSPDLQHVIFDLSKLTLKQDQTAPTYADACRPSELAGSESCSACECPSWDAVSTEDSDDEYEDDYQERGGGKRRGDRSNSIYSKKLKRSEKKMSLIQSQTAFSTIETMPADSTTSTDDTTLVSGGKTPEHMSSQISSSSDPAYGVEEDSAKHVPGCPGSDGNLTHQTVLPPTSDIHTAGVSNDTFKQDFVENEALHIPLEPDVLQYCQGLAEEHISGLNYLFGATATPTGHDYGLPNGDATSHGHDYGLPNGDVTSPGHDYGLPNGDVDGGVDCLPSESTGYQDDTHYISYNQSTDLCADSYNICGRSMLDELNELLGFNNGAQNARSNTYQSSHTPRSPEDSSYLAESPDQSASSELDNVPSAPSLLPPELDDVHTDHSLLSSDLDDIQTDPSLLSSSSWPLTTHPQYREQMSHSSHNSGIDVDYLLTDLSDDSMSQRSDLPESGSDTHNSEKSIASSLISTGRAAVPQHSKAITHIPPDTEQSSLTGHSPHVSCSVTRLRSSQFVSPDQLLEDINTFDFEYPSSAEQPGPSSHGSQSSSQNDVHLGSKITKTESSFGIISSGGSTNAPNDSPNYTATSCPTGLSSPYGPDVTPTPVCPTRETTTTVCFVDDSVPKSNNKLFIERVHYDSHGIQFTQRDICHENTMSYHNCTNLYNTNQTKEGQAASCGTNDAGFRQNESKASSQCQTCPEIEHQTSIPGLATSSASSTPSSNEAGVDNAPLAQATFEYVNSERPCVPIHPPLPSLFLSPDALPRGIFVGESGVGCKADPLISDTSSSPPASSSAEMKPTSCFPSVGPTPSHGCTLKPLDSGQRCSQSESRFMPNTKQLPTLHPKPTSSAGTWHSGSMDGLASMPISISSVLSKPTPVNHLLTTSWITQLHAPTPTFELPTAPTEPLTSAPLEKAGVDMVELHKLAIMSAWRDLVTPEKIYSRDCQGHTLLMQASMQGKLEDVYVIIEYLRYLNQFQKAICEKNHHDDSILHLVVKCNQSDSLAILLHYICQLPALGSVLPQLKEQCDYCLHEAVCMGDSGLTTVKVLTAVPMVTLDFRNEMGQTPLRCAIEKHSRLMRQQCNQTLCTQVIAHLVDLGADVSDRTGCLSNTKYTPIHDVIRTGDVTLIRAVMDRVPHHLRRTVLREKDAQGNSALHVLSKSPVDHRQEQGLYDIVQYLVNHGADVMEKNENHHYAEFSNIFKRVQHEMKALRGSAPRTRRPPRKKTLSL